MGTSDTLVGATRKSYVPVPLDLLLAGGAIPFSLYSRPGAGTVKMVCPAGEVLAVETVRAWEQVGVSVLYVDTADHRLYQRYAEAAMSKLLGQERLPGKRKAELYYQTTRELVREACDSSGVNEIIGGRRESWVNNMVTLICGDEAAMNGMLMMLSHDYYTYTHMVNVSVMVTALAYRLGERDPGRLAELASGGLLHDIGKMRVNPNTLNKAERLTDAEWEELKAHPGLGLQLLHGRPGIKASELWMVHQHHEKLDGSGYPLGLLGQEISVEAQMTAVVDIYDALTCKRPYRRALSHEKALAVLDQESAVKINRDMVAVWQETIERARQMEERRD